MKHMLQVRRQDGMHHSKPRKMVLIPQIPSHGVGPSLDGTVAGYYFEAGSGLYFPTTFVNFFSSPSSSGAKTRGLPVTEINILRSFKWKEVGDISSGRRILFQCDGLRSPNNRTLWAPQRQII
jgi:hypothetical protein